MPLDTFQTEVATLALGLPSAASLVLVGGAAMLAYGLVDRPTHDIDLFTPQQADVSVVAADLVEALVARGYNVDVQRTHPSFVSLTVSEVDGRSLDVDLAYDTRIRAPTRLKVGNVAHIEELAADKALALFDRAEPWDLVDVDALTLRFGLERLTALAREKDHGFDPVVFGQALRAAAGQPDARFGAIGVTGSQLARLRERARSWADELVPPR